ncbi:glycosyltransferase [Patescibacteria group bacterium]|nr:glycosyltransferase [Patescibacteria group bacterium]
MNINPKVSVIMAVFNGQQYVGEAIKNILEQTFKNFEFIIVNDGSTDKTEEILTNWEKKDSRIKIISNPSNIGLTKSLNKAIDVVQGKYIARQDADDISLPQRLEKQVVFLEDHLEIKVLGTFGYAINQEGKILREETLPVSHQDIKNVLIRRNPFIHTSVMIRKEIINKVGKYNEDFKVIQDYELWFRILKVAKGENLPLFLVKKKYQPEMISSKRNKEQIKQAILLKKRVIKSKDYPIICYVYLLRDYLSLACPPFLKIFINKYFLRRGIF